MLISVIIPVYNSESIIQESVESVVLSIKRVTEDYEIILVNDGSTDNSFSILQMIAENNDNIIIIDQVNQGAAVARNTGLDIAKGEIIAFNDSDDRWVPDAFENRLQILNNHDNVSCIAANHDVTKQNLFFLRKVSEDLFKITLNAELFKCYFSPPTVLLRRQIIDDGMRFNPSMTHAEEGYFFNHIVSKYECVILNKKVSESILQKQRFGESGLSGNIKLMERGELYNLKNAYKELHGSLFLYISTITFSYIKYIRRIALVKVRTLRELLN